MNNKSNRFSPEMRERAVRMVQDWFNHIRLLEPIGYIPPAEAEENYYRQLANSQETIVST